MNLIFGAKDKQSPYPKINFTSQRESTSFFSRTNFNLFLTPEERPYVSLSTLLEKSNEIDEFKRELVFAPESCYHCTERAMYCPLIVKSTDQEVLTIDDRSLPVMWWRLKNDVEIASWITDCPFLQSLLDLTETKAERKFMKLYLDYELKDYVGDGVGLGLSGELASSSYTFLERNRDLIADILDSEPERRVPGHRGWGRARKWELERYGVPPIVAIIYDEEYDRSRLLGTIREDTPARLRFLLERASALGAIGFRVSIGTANNLTSWEIHRFGEWLRSPLAKCPALIPQVWLRHIHDPKLGPNDPLKVEAYSRVDFVMLWNEKKLVIEIDGPEHYAEWDRTQRTWHVSETTYTRNLKRERQLREDGWLFFRLSNQEVEKASSWHDIERLIGFYELVEKGADPPDYYLFD